MSTNQAVDTKFTGDADVDALTVTEGDGGLDVEGLARQLGHIEKDKFRGKEEDWLPAEKFLEKAIKDRVSDRARIRYQDQHIQKLMGELGEVKAMVKKLDETQEEFVTRQRESTQRSYDHAMRDLEAEMDAAVADADSDRYRRAKHQLLELGKMKATDTKPKEEKKTDPLANANGTKGAATPPPEVQEWVRDNASWFNPDDPDDDASVFAMTHDAKLLRKNRHMSTVERLEKVKEATMQRFPEKFGNPARSQAAAVARPGAQAVGSAARKKQKTVSDLPDDAKAALSMLKRKDPKMTDEMYLKHYQWDK